METNLKSVGVTRGRSTVVFLVEGPELDVMVHSGDGSRQH